MTILYSLRTRLFPPERSRAVRSGDEARMARCLAQASLLVVGADIGEPLAFDASPDAAIEVVGVAAEKRAFEDRIHKFTIEGDSFVPVFTDSVAAEMFCGAYASLVGQLHAFRLFRVRGSAVSRWVSRGDLLVVNPQSPSEAQLTAAETAEISAHLFDVGASSESELVSVVLPMFGVSRTIGFGPEA